MSAQLAVVGQPWDFQLSDPVIAGAGGQPTRMSDVFRKMPRIIESLQDQGIVRRIKWLDNGTWVHSDTCGWAMPRPIRTASVRNGKNGGSLDKPGILGWCTGGFGPEANVLRTAGNAIRKHRLMFDPFAKNYESTLSIVEHAAALDLKIPSIVDSVELNGSMLWGNFPHGGSVVVFDRGWIVPFAVSGYTARQNHLIATAGATVMIDWLEKNDIKEVIVLDEAA